LLLDFSFFGKVKIFFLKNFVLRYEVEIFQVNLPINYIEKMGKKIIFKILTIVSLVLVIGYFLFSFLFFSNKKQNLICKKIEITIVDKNKIQLIDERNIIEFLQKSNLYPVGKTLSEVRTEEIECAIAKNPFVKDIECYLTPSAVFNVRIRQRMPKFRVMGSENFYVDTERKTMPVSTNYAAYVQVVSGRLTKSFATKELFDFVDFIENDDFWDAQIQQIYVIDNKEIELIPRVGDATVRLGEIENYKNKLEKLKKLYVEAFSEIGWNRYKVIDLRFKNQVVCIKKEEI
jgi:cell division protein FtsQ